jgi:hypothetical protein
MYSLSIAIVGSTVLIIAKGELNARIDRRLNELYIRKGVSCIVNNNSVRCRH